MPLNNLKKFYLTFFNVKLGHSIEKTDNFDIDIRYNKTKDFITPLTIEGIEIEKKKNDFINLLEFKPDSIETSANTT